MITRKEFVKKWIAALRSGDYKQGRTYLRSTLHPEDGVRWCCLGVACDLAVQEGLLVEDQSEQYSRYHGRPDLRDTTSATLPTSLSDWLRCSEDPEIAGHTTATEANDNLLWSFHHIAAAIEDNVLPYVKESP